MKTLLWNPITSPDRDTKYLIIFFQLIHHAMEMQIVYVAVLFFFSFDGCKSRVFDLFRRTKANVTIADPSFPLLCLRPGAIGEIVEIVSLLELIHRKLQHIYGPHYFLKRIGSMGKNKISSQFLECRGPRNDNKIFPNVIT